MMTSTALVALLFLGLVQFFNVHGEDIKIDTRPVENDAGKKINFKLLK